MKIIQLLQPESLLLNCYWVTAGLPKLPRSIQSRLITQCFQETFWAMLNAIIAELPAGELAEVSERSFQASIIKIRIKDDQMEMSRHNDIGIDAQLFFSMTKGEAVGNDLTTGL